MTEWLLRLRLLAIAAACAATVAGCGEIEPDRPVDDQGQPIPMPDPGEDWLYFEAVEPRQTLSTRPTIALRFNQYLDPTTFRSFDTATLESGGHVRSGVVDYRMTRKTLLFRPHNLLEPGLRYDLRWSADDVRSVVGSPLHPQVMLPAGYRVRDQADPVEPFERPTVTWDDVQPLFEDHCSDCHADQSRGLPEMTRDQLVGRRSDQTDTMLVEPYHPARSYLMHKILPDYPMRRHTVQPPPYSDEANRLSTDDIERIEHWIAGGARP